MSFSALVIGFGSIGRRHADLLHKMDEISRVAVLSSQTGVPYETIQSLDAVPDLKPDYVVLASPTNQHYAQLLFLEKKLRGKKILVEKPLFADDSGFPVKNNDVFVGYNLRFHPLVQKVREVVAERKLWSVDAFCGSYLPDWRSGRDYRTTSSARKASGGGALLDLSHELDYVQWLAGPLGVEYAVSEKVSTLDIDTDDLMLFSGRSQDGAYVHIALNYFTREPVRRFIIDGEGVSVQGDLIASTLKMTVDGESSELAWPGLGRNSTYLAQHRAVLEGNANSLCSYEEGLRTMSLIERIRSWNRT